jgi:hypothetical protein
MKAFHIARGPSAAKHLRDARSSAKSWRKRVGGGVGERCDRRGRPLEPVEWLDQVQGDCVLARTVVGGLVVETVWVGLDLEYTADGRPCIFWTGVRGDPALFLRSPNEQAAQDAHRRLVRWLWMQRHPHLPAPPPTLWSDLEGEG